MKNAIRRLFIGTGNDELICATEYTKSLTTINSSKVLVPLEILQNNIQYCIHIDSYPCIHQLEHNSE